MQRFIENKIYKDETQEKNDWNSKIEELLKLRSSTVQEKAARLGGRKTRKKYRKKNKTVGKSN